MARAEWLPYLYGARSGRPHLYGAAPIKAWIWVVHRQSRPHLFSTPLDDPDLCGACRDDARIYVVRS